MVNHPPAEVVKDLENTENKDIVETVLQDVRDGKEHGYHNDA